MDAGLVCSSSSSSYDRSFNWRWCEGGGLITPDGAAINLERREEVLDTSALGPTHTLLVVLCHRAAIAAKEYLLQHHVERGVLDNFALDLVLHHVGPRYSLQVVIDTSVLECRSSLRASFGSSQDPL